MRHQILHDLGACVEAVRWAEQYDTLQAAWDACDNGSRMLWYAGACSGPAGDPRRKPLVLCCVECARLAWPYVRDRDRAVVQRCYETSESWARDQGATLEDVRVAADAAADAAYDATSAAWAAVDAAYAAAYAASDAVAYAASAAAGAAAYAASAAERARMLRECADVVRRHYPVCPAQ